MKFRQLIFSSILWRGIYFFTVLLLNIMLARFFQATLSGMVFYISNYFSFMLLIGSFCLESGMTYYSSQQKINEHQLAWLSVVWSVVVTIVLLIFFPFWSSGMGDGFSVNDMLFFAASYISGILLTTYFAALFYAQKNFSLPNIILSFTNLLLIFIAAVLFFLKLTVQYQSIFLKLYFFTFCIQGLFLSVAYIVKNNGYKNITLPQWGNLKLLFKYSVVVLMGNIVFFLLYRVDYWFVKNKCLVCEASDLGNYIQVSKLGQLFLIFPTIIASALFPLTAGGNHEQARKNMLVLSRALFVFNFFALTFLAVTGRWLFPFVFGESFNKMYKPFLLLIPGIFSLSSVALLAAYNSGVHKMNQTLAGTIIALIVIVIGDIIIIPSFGIKGAALISSAGYITYLLFVATLFSYQNKIPIRQFVIPTKNDLKLIKQIFGQLKS